MSLIGNIQYHMTNMMDAHIKQCFPGSPYTQPFWTNNPKIVYNSKEKTSVDDISVRPSLIDVFGLLHGTSS